MRPDLVINIWAALAAILATPQKLGLFVSVILIAALALWACGSGIMQRVHHSRPTT